MNAFLATTGACVDVVVPVFNGRNTIVQALGSALNQNGPWLSRIIVVDDGSTDGTAEVVESMGRSEIQVFRTTNHGVAAARNMGVVQATAPWIAFLDADDLWMPDKLQTQLLAARKQDVSFVCGTVNNRPVPGLARLSAWTLWKGNYIATSSVLVRHDVLFQVAPVFQTGMPFAEDYLAWLKCLSVTPGFYVSSNVATYILSETPRYKWRAVLKNTFRMNWLFAQFLWRQDKPFGMKAALPFALLAGSAVSLASICKRFLRSTS
jgi:glycosyltransferase involved in cell wall biosynthesis